MEELIEDAARWNVAEVKAVLASVALSLGVYQLVVIAVGYGKLRLSFLDVGPVIASSPIDGVHFDAATHAALGRAVADAVAAVFP